MNDLTLYSFHHYTFLLPEDGPQWPKYVDSLIKQRYKDSCVLTYLSPPNRELQNVCCKVGTLVQGQERKIFLLPPRPPPHLPAPV